MNSIGCGTSMRKVASNQLPTASEWKQSVSSHFQEAPGFHSRGEHAALPKLYRSTTPSSLHQNGQWEGGLPRELSFSTIRRAQEGPPTAWNCSAPRCKTTDAFFKKNFYSSSSKILATILHPFGLLAMKWEGLGGGVLQIDLLGKSGTFHFFPFI